METFEDVSFVFRFFFAITLQLIVNRILILISFSVVLISDMALCDCPVGVPIGPTLASTCGGGQFMLFMGLLEVFLRSQCDLEDPCNRPKVWQFHSFEKNTQMKKSFS